MAYKGHGEGVLPCPSGEQVSCIPLLQVTAPGVHCQGTHTPLTQPCPLAQLITVLLSPSALQTRRALGPLHALVPGAHARGTHMPSVHDSPEAQSCWTTQSTQRPRWVSQT